MRKEANGFGPIGIVVILAVIVLVAGGGLYAIKQRRSNFLFPGSGVIKFLGFLPPGQVTLEEKKLLQEHNIGIRKEEQIDTSNWKTYRNEKYGFEVKYPATGNVQDVPAGLDHIISAVDFNVGGTVIRVSFYKNSRSDKTFQELFQARGGGSMPETGDLINYQQISLNGFNVLRKVNTLPNG